MNSQLEEFDTLKQGKTKRKIYLMSNMDEYIDVIS